ncbi:hypothetical protein [Oceanimonas baumannii]|uniref:Thioredoxin family protein n=1 Tax=Oceanimonas baumannii TaxID=129578 RepID=A0A235CHP1_9GAMM|nr:hypothetical protein [Oceanimonas baumannii]OYD23547.1 hypothetical protein B6S09_11405 [Oceanimonas baumannii]TDW56917.1 hypothetical protein LY04_02929 [Oceanimonas baumannii]
MKHKPVLGLIAVFLLPPLLAALVLSQGWFTPGVRGHGEWVQGNISAAGQWRLVLVTDDPCDYCAPAKRMLNNLDLALGRDEVRVMVTEQPAGGLLEAGFVYIADPPGLLVMRYPMATDAGQNRHTGKALLEDLRRLLKYSRAG